MPTGRIPTSMLWLSCCISLALAPLAQAEAPPPRIGLVLGGGGARGAAHLGVLEVLERLRVPVDCIAGTSMGALVAGAYASGVTPQTMKNEMAAANWSDMFQDNPTFSELSYRNKRISQRFLPGSETGIKEDGLQYQSGVVAGQKIKLFFNQLVHADRGEPQIQSLPLPLSIIATDIGTGSRVVLREGSLTQAMRASMSVPGLMTPVQLDGHKLVDGGLVDNVPIAEVRERCQPDVVIAVNVGSPLLKPDEINSLLSVSAQMVNILTEQNVSRSLATLKPDDIYIQPDLEGISAGDFPRNAETAERGRIATEAVAGKLARYSVSEARYQQWRQHLEAKLPALPRIDEVQVADMTHVNKAVVSRHIEQQPGSSVAPQLGRDLLRVYGDGFYEHVDYSLLGSRDRTILRITPVEKSWGPDYLRLGVNLENTFDGNASYSLRAAYHKTWMNNLGAEMIAFTEIGNRNMLGFEFYQPLDERQRFFVEPMASYSDELRNFYQDNQKRAEYRVKTSQLNLGVGVNIGLLGQARLGWRETWLDAALETGTPELGNNNQHFGSAYLALDLDQMDRLYLPTSGWAARLAYSDSPQLNYGNLSGSLSGATPLGPLIVSGKFRASQTLHGSVPFYEASKLGGFLNLSGYAQDQLVGDDMRFAQLRAEKIIGQLPLGLRGDMRLGLALEGATFGRRFSESQLEGWQASATLYLGGETPLGPVYLGYGHAKQGPNAVYLFLGTP
ncbi:patatin-like phospholipase family protein [Craterilacuibacter sinensis]|uniref:BamA/TamA family outer membrane protein n=1 Tax=Craterilacuibacter sinensis TaxID=2686017 RepID=A0A845BRQ7_9NEIS|nr:patatin-like phospholipase family protein [Craterilacuibacter sinensis]MXR36896.1 BamA/TamA family outer membrane protein [Craterilacuibacter sinensis]